MSDRHWKLLEQDYADAWSSLPEAPPLRPRSKGAQITLRIATGRRARIRAVAAARSLPYHALARSWLIDALRDVPSQQPSGRSESFTEQLNLKLDQETLDQLKRRADTLRRPYHALAREYIDAALVAEEARLGLDPSPASTPDIDRVTSPLPSL